MKRISEILMIGVFAVFITVSMAVTLSNRDETYSYFENRLYATVPEVTAESVAGGEFFSGLESFLCDHAAGRQILLKAKTYTDARILRRPVVNDVVVTGDVLLPYNPYEKTDKMQIAQQAESMAAQHGKLREQIESYGGSYIYTAVPCQYVCYENSYPSYLNSRKEFTEAEISTLTASMEKYGVSMIDMLPVFERTAEGAADRSVTDGGSDNVNNRLFYSSAVDNHYSLEGAYVTYREIIDRINDQTGYSLKYPAGDEITFSEVPEPYLGSRQRKLMGVIPWDEHLKKAVFRSEIPFTRMDNGQAVEASVYSDAAFEDGKVTYSLYMGGDIPETVIDTNRPELPSVLIYGDSFTNAVETLAYYSFDEMRSIDMRYYKEMSVSQYIDKYKPDIVICIRDYESLLASDGNGNLFSVQ
ncbi:MAG: hypothetical protein V8Q39_05485 [Anaerovoracaceae bacterium]